MKINTILLLSTAYVLSACGTNSTSVADPVGNTIYQTVDEANMDKNVSPREDFFEFSNGVEDLVHQKRGQPQ